MIELNRIYNEDCLKTMAKMDDNSVDCVITSPPYNTGGKSLNKSVEKYYDIYKDNLSNDEYSKFIIDVLKETIRISKYYVFFNYQILSNNKRTFLSIPHLFADHIKDQFIWRKQAVAQIQRGKMATGYEIVLILGKDDSMVFERNNFPDNNYVPNIMEWFKKDHIEGHGATFTIEMVSYFIKYFTMPGDIIYDPFMGSGTTAISCIKSGRKYIGSEISLNYCEIAEKRILPYKQQIDIFYNAGVV